MSIRLSIGSAVYNIDEPFLRAHIEGILRQLTEETELLLIDDCSTNNSGEICREYAAADKRVHYIHMGVNSGLSSVRNRTIEVAQGKWIFFADADDLVSDNFVQTALRYCDSSAEIIIHDRLKFTDSKQPEEAPYEKELISLPPDAGRAISISCMCLDPNISADLHLPTRAFFHAAWGALYQKEFLTKHRLLFPVGQKKAQDAVFNTQAYHCAQRIAYLPYVMYYYRNNPQGITHRYSRNLTEVLASLIGHLSNCLESYYAEDADVRERFMNHRIMATVMDNLRLNLFHKDNPKPREQRRKEFLAFIGEEPYKRAIADFDAKKSGRWEWLLIVKLVRKKRFGALNLIVRHDRIYRLSCGVYKRIAKLFG